MGRARWLSITEPGVALFNDQGFCSGVRFFGVFRLFLFLQSSTASCFDFQRGLVAWLGP